MKSARLLCACACLLPTACATEGGGPFGFVMFDQKHHVAAAEPLFGDGDETCLNDPTFLLTIYAPETPSPKGDVDVCTRMKRAIGWALVPHGAAGASYSSEQRNEVVDALMGASDRKCGRYTAFLQQYDANVNGGFGVLAQATSALATLATGGTAKWLAAGSTLSEGTRGTLNNALFANKTIGVLAQAYENRRDNDRKAIQDALNTELSKYSLMRGIADVFRYHADCSIVVGLQETQQAVSDEVNKDGNNKTAGTNSTKDTQTGNGNAAGAAGGGTAAGTNGGTPATGAAGPNPPPQPAKP